MTTANISRRIFTRFASSILLGIACCAAYGAEVRGRVLDETGATIAGARIEAASRGATYKTVSDPRGEFSISGVETPGKIYVSAAGFSPSVLDFDESRHDFTVKLKLAPVGETVVVTGERDPSRMDETAANISLLTSAEVSSRAVPTLDDALRQVPGFTLFRRSNSLTANPTTQGASARGVGASGASRALVLEDGVPLNDPFGGWVFWDRIPRLALDHAEVLRGGESLYGSSALGGVVDLVRQKNPGLVTIEAAGDSLSGHDVQALASHEFRQWTMSASGESFGNDGAFIVASEDRGLVDAPASLAFGNGEARVERKIGEMGAAFVSGGLFSEERNNGTTLQVNSTHMGTLTSGMDAAAGRNTFSLRAYGSGEHYHQSFSAIAVDRNTEALTRWQTAPSDQVGFSAQWMRAGSAYQLTAGTDGRFIHGETDETAFSAGHATNLTVAGGRDHLLGGFAEIATTLKHRLRASAGIRADRWSNDDGFNRLTSLSTGHTISTPLAPHTETAYSPRGGLVYSVNDHWQLTASAYAGFRAPTLNELYRSFRQGNALTLANEGLQAEHMQGGEAGVRYLRRRMLLSGVFFRANVDDPIGNITLSSTPALITRQRQNMGALRSAGADIDLLLLLPRVQLRGGYEYVSSTVTSFSANPVLVGKAVPQVPAHSGSASAVYAAPRRWTIVGMVRAASRQFDDDLNLFPLRPYSLVGISVSKQTGRIAWFGSAANLLDSKIQTAATPVATYATPRIISAGIRFSSGR